jgi:hypothetical protein
VTRSTVESIRKIDVNALHRKGCFGAQRREFPVTWSIDGKTTGVVIASADHWGMELNYHSDHRNEPVRVTVPITWTRCHLGGFRPWFRCDCGRRVGTLFELHQFYVCRTCRQLNYEAQQFSRKRRERLNFLAFRIHERLGGRPNSLDPFPVKPKGPRWRTYERLGARAEMTERKRDEACLDARNRIVAAMPHLDAFSRDQLLDLKKTSAAYLCNGRLSACRHGSAFLSILSGRLAARRSDYRRPGPCFMEISYRPDN